MSDAELVARTRAGEQDAFATLYERHYGGVYDFALRMLRDRDAAADVVQSTFAKAWPALRATDGVENVAAWLYAVARNSAIDELRHRARLALDRIDDGRDLGLAELPAPPDTDPAAIAESKELAELVWSSAAGLNSKEYSLLDLHVRRGLSADELAENLGVRRGAVYTRLTRLRSSLEQAVTTTLLLRRGRPECAELDGLASRLDVSPVSRSARKDVERHVETCTTCQETKGLYASPAQIFAALSLVAPPDDLAAAVWPIVGGSAAAGAGAGALAGAASREPGRGALAGASTAVVAGLGVVIIGSLLAASLLDDPSGRSPAERGATPRLPRAAPVVVDPRNVGESRARIVGPGASRPEALPRAEPPSGAKGDAPAGASPPSTGSGPPTEGSPPPSPPPPPASPPPPPPPRPSDPPPPAQPPSPTPPPPPPPPPPPAPPPAPPPPPPPAVPPASPPPAPPQPPPPPPPPPPAPPPPADDPDDKRVEICHHGATITISRSAVPAHLDHGDTLGACP